MASHPGVPALISLIGRCAPFFNAVYFAADHVVLAKQVNTRRCRDAWPHKRCTGLILLLLGVVVHPLQAGIISSSDVAARAQNYSLLACTSHRCSFHGIHHARVCSIAADRVAAGLASSVCGAVVSHARVNAIKARKRDEDNEQVALLLPCFCCELFPGY